MCAYKNSAFHITTAKRIIDIKIARRVSLLKKYKMPHTIDDISVESIAQVLLFEAREAKVYWKKFKALLPAWTLFISRKPRRKDIANQLLDSGYHHLANKVRALLVSHEMSASMGILHSAKTSDSTTLVYDLMELFRADVVEAETLRYLRLKKKPLLVLTGKDIGRFLHRINMRLAEQYYLRDFKQCHV